VIHSSGRRLSGINDCRKFNQVAAGGLKMIANNKKLIIPW